MDKKKKKKFFLQNKGYTLYSNNGCTSKRWYFLYYLNQAGVLFPYKLYGGINRYSNADERFYAAKRLLNTLDVSNPKIEFDIEDLQNIFDVALKKRIPYLRKKSIATYQSKINDFLDFCRRNRIDKLRKIDKKIATKYLQELLQKNNTTVNSYIITFKRLFKDFVKENKIRFNPFEEIKKLPENRKGKMYFNTNQIEVLKSEIIKQNRILWFACQLQYYCFIRPNEIRFLKIEHINTVDGTIKIDASFSKNKKTQVVVIPNCFLSDFIALSNKNENDYLIQINNEQLKRDYLSKEHKKILAKLGFSNRYSFYSWKHTGAYMAVKGGIKLKDLQLQLRHHSLDQVNEYLREMGVLDCDDLKNKYPAL